MSPKSIKGKQKEHKQMLQRRRREQHGDDVSVAAGMSGPAALMDAAGADAAADLAIMAASVPVPGTDEQLQLVSQESRPSTELVPAKAKGSGGGNQLAVDTKSLQHIQAAYVEECQTPTNTEVVQSIQNGQSTPNSKRNQLEELKEEKEPAASFPVPQGMPQSFGPAATPVPVQPNFTGPLFTPEQLAHMEQVERQAPMLMPTKPSLLMTSGLMMPGLGSGAIDAGHLDLPQPGIDPGLRELQQSQQREAQWRLQAERMFEQMALQLRASQAENSRLRSEVQQLMEHRGSSRFATPEEKTGGFEGKNKEDGPAGRKDQGRSKEDGPGGQQDLLRSKEDGPTGQQELIEGEESEEPSSSEDGSEDQQESSQEGVGSSSSEEDGPVGRQEMKGSKVEAVQGKKRRSSKDETVKVMLKLMQGMQTMQQQLIKKDKKARKKGEVIDEEEELVRSSQDLHPLPEWSHDNAPVDFQDWILVVSSQMADLTTSSSTWWEKTMETARQWYKDHQKLKPLEKLRHQVRAPPELQVPKWRRLEKRASTLVLKALPESQRQDLIAAKDLSVLGMICRLMLNYQPGGGQEKQAVLAAIEAPQEAGNISEAVTGLKRWLRWKRRADDVGVTLPDSSVVLRGLDRLLGKVLQSNATLNFRINLARTTLMVDAAPTMSGVEQLAECVLAELDAMAYAKRKATPSTALNPAEKPKLKKFEEGGKGDDEPRGRGKPREEVESKKPPCKFYLTDQGCKRGRECPFGHVADSERRCWACGSKEHLSSGCPRKDGKTTRTAKAALKSPEKESKGAASSKSPGDEKEGTEAPQDPAEDTMQLLIQEANKMLQSIESEKNEVSQKKANVKSGQLQDLQRQLEMLKKASLKPFRISRMGTSSKKGLLDSGATHPLREKKKYEQIQCLPKVRVTLAGDKEADMRLTPTGVIIGGPGTEPIVPMGLLTSLLGCQVSWTQDGLQVRHPKNGLLDVTIEDGCPMIPKGVALELIDEIEKTMAVKIRSVSLGEDPEVKFLQRMVEEHPVFRTLPDHIKQSLIEVPAADLRELGNRRTRRLWRKEGVIVHAFSGSKEGYTLKRAVHEVGGDKRKIYEFDLVHGRERDDLSTKGQGYKSLIRLALSGQVLAWVGGPPCRTRSVLRHFQVPGMKLPRPVRAWEEDQTFGLKDLTQHEKDQVETDDVLMWRFLMLFAISDLVRGAEGSDEEPIPLLLEQPAEPIDKEEVVSFWRTKEWKDFEKLYKLRRQTFDQSEFGSLATKPTTIAGRMRVEVPMKGRKGSARKTEGKTAEQLCQESRDLARWPPLLMRAIAVEIQSKIFKKKVMLRKMSWAEHVAAGHTNTVPERLPGMSRSFCS